MDVTGKKSCRENCKERADLLLLNTSSDEVMRRRRRMIISNVTSSRWMPTVKNEV